MIRKLPFFIGFIIIIFSFFIPVVSAQGEFHTDIKITYEYFQDGTSKVTQAYTLTNLTSETGASAYEFDIYDQTPRNLTAFDQRGKLDLKLVNHQSGLTRVLIPFKQLTAGKGKSYSFYLSYTGPQITRVDGLWKISLPVISSSEAGQEISIQLIVPEQFGKPLTLYPTTTSFIKKDGQLIYNFEPDNLQTGSGIYAIFGNLNLIGFRLTYSSSEKTDNLYLPMDAPGQLVFIQSIVPAPENVLASDGHQWSLFYRHKPDTVQVNGYLLVEASSSASFPETGHLSLRNLTSLPEAVPSTPRIKWQRPFQIFPFISLPSTITITNPGSQSIYHLSVRTGMTNLRSDTPSETVIPVIPPLGHIDIPVNLYADWLPQPDTSQFMVYAGDINITYNIPVVLFIIWYVIVVIIIIIMFAAMGYITYRTWSIHIQKRNRFGAIRR